MELANFPGRPGSRVRTTASFASPPRWIFIPLFIILAAAYLILAGCTDKEIISPGNGDEPDAPICPLNSPWVEIVSPDVGDAIYYSPRITFSWKQNAQYKIAFTKYMLAELLPGDDGLAMLNDNPERFDDMWSQWEPWGPAGGSAIVGEESHLEDGTYLFAVQALDSCGKMTDHFSYNNARQFTVRKNYPVLVVMEPALGTGVFMGTEQRHPAIHVFPGSSLSFSWSAEPTYPWFGHIEYRLGWDIQNLQDDEEWSSWSSEWTGSFQSNYNRFQSGVHVLYIDARDDAGTITRAHIEIEIIEFTAELNLLWIDDFLLGNDPILDRHFPTETEHDEFWEGICSLAPGFIPSRDIYEADQNDRRSPLPIEVLARYKNIIWTYDGSDENVWSSTIKFSPAGYALPFQRPNNLKLFLSAGGNALTCGMSFRAGSALSALFPQAPLFPASTVENLADYDYDMDFARSSMARDDYYVTFIDKVQGPFRSTLPGGIIRSEDRDAMRMAIEVGVSPFPDTLRLWEEIAGPGMYFDPTERGFTFVEAYDPEYYMDYRMMNSHRCFRPIYRMRSRSTLSPLNDAAIAIWTMHHDCECDEEYPCNPYRGNAHFGIPLWFMDHSQVETIAEYMFYNWRID